MFRIEKGIKRGKTLRMHIVYIIEDQKTKSRYIGYTTNLRRRLQEHRQHKNISTAYGTNWKLIYAEAYLNKMDALGRERFLKSGSGWRYIRKQLRNYLESDIYTQ